MFLKSLQEGLFGMCGIFKIFFRDDSNIELINYDLEAQTYNQTDTWEPPRSIDEKIDALFRNVLDVLSSTATNSIKALKYPIQRCLRRCGIKDHKKFQ